MWAVARFELNLSDEEFWSMSPGLFHSLCARWHKLRNRHDFIIAGVVASAIVNVNLRRGAEPLTPLDFVPGHRTKKQSSAEMLRMFRILTDTTDTTVN